MVTTPIRKQADIDLLKQYFLDSGQYRDYAMFVIGINTALRISDLLCLKWKDVYDFEKHNYKIHVYVSEQKTKKQNCIALNKNSKAALCILMKYNKPKEGEEYLFCSRNNRYQKISRNRAYHIIKQAAQLNNIDGNVSCHSLRKTFGYHAWKNSVPPALIMSVYNHTNMETTKRYLSIIQDDKDELFQKINL